MVRVLFVCLGNICRSPTANGVFRAMVEQEGLGDHIETDSAGTHAYHTGEGADRRAFASARNRGVDLSPHRARQVREDDFHRFDYVLAMDRENYDDLMSLSPSGTADRVRMFLGFAPHLDHDEVPDPYYGGPDGFDRVLDMIEEAAAGLLEEIRTRHL